MCRLEGEVDVVHVPLLGHGLTRPRFSHAGPFLEIVATLLSSSVCPKPVMSLSAQALVRAFSDPRARGSGAVPPPSLVNLWNTVNKRLGLPESTFPSFYPIVGVLKGRE